jgi:hypothetical protein
MADESPRLALPFLAAGQAQKEATHNEALQRIDLAVQPAVTAIATTPPANPAEGQAWIVGAAATGAWAGRGGQVAGWTGGGWRYLLPFEGFRAWLVDERLTARFVGGTWVTGEVRARRVLVNGVPVLGARQPSVADPTGGAIVDAQARAAVAAVLSALRAHGLIAS